MNVDENIVNKGSLTAREVYGLTSPEWLEEITKDESPNRKLARLRYNVTLYALAILFDAVAIAVFLSLTSPEAAYFLPFLYVVCAVIVAQSALMLKYL